MTEAATSEAAKPEPWEARLPEWQRWLNRFCENWIFAFIIAFGIRHFALEAFQIPTASMEPTMWGDAGFTRRDFVLVDKVTQRFRDPRRWEVTVFQFPHPEIEVRGRDESAYDELERRRDHPLTRPLMYRNFVKRALVLPGETFYFAGGDLFIKGADGRFAIARKPAAIQEAVWMPVYRHGAEREPEWYVPWTAGAQAAVGNLQEKGLRLAVAPGEGGEVVFDQPLTNLYFKQGPVSAARRDPKSAPSVVQASLLEPLFAHPSGVTGNVWRMDQWWLRRVTTNDLDNPHHGADLNHVMRDRVGDVRVVATVGALEDTVTLRLAQGGNRWYDLRLGQAGWVVAAGDGEGTRELGRGDGRPTAFSFALIDQQVVAVLDGREAVRHDIPGSDPQADPVAISWRGKGAITLSALEIQRDLHYTAVGFLQPESVPSTDADGRPIDLGSRRDWEEADRTLRSTVPVPPPQIVEAAKRVRHLRDVREQMLGRELRRGEEWKRLGFSPETAITAPADGYLMCGDNSPFSWDGRHWGYVPKANLRGRVILRVRARTVAGIPLPFTDWGIVR